MRRMAATAFTIVLSACAHSVSPVDAIDSHDAAADADAASESCFPPCLESLFAQCPPTPPCTREETGVNAQISCFANGTRSSYAALDSSNDRSEVDLPDGGRCFSSECHLDASSGTCSIADREGHHVVDLRQDEIGIVTVTCGGVSTVVDTRRPVCANHYWAQVELCAVGSCAR